MPYRWLHCFAALLAAAACETHSVVVVDVATVALLPADTAIFAGDSTRLRAVPRGPGGEALANRPTAWSTTAPDVATVEDDGLVRGIAPGDALISVTTAGVEADARVRVLEPPSLLAEPSFVALSAVASGVSEAAVVQLFNGGGGEINGLSAAVTYPPDSAEGWLTAGLNGTSAPTSLTVTASAASLHEGGYTAFAIVTSDDGLRARLDVELTVTASPASIVLGTNSVVFSAVEGEGVSAVQEVEVRNGGGGALTGLTAAVRYAEGSPTGWLAASLSARAAPAVLTVRATTSGMTAGTYEADVLVRAQGVSDPALLPIRLTVAPASASSLRSGSGSAAP